MTGMLRSLGLSLVFVALAAPVTVAQDLKDSFDAGVAQLRRDNVDEALATFQEILASDPDQSAAYELWSSTDHEDWIELLTRGGEFELFAKNMMELVKLGHKERQNDPDAIRAHVQTIVGDGSTAERRQAEHRLAADHGHYAVAYMVPFLADPADDDGRIRVMAALRNLGSAAVLPLVEALRADDAFLRRNVAITLGNIRDARALPMLMHLAQADPDGGVRQAASEAAAKIGSDGSSALTLFIRQGDDYHHGRDTVLRDYQKADVVWNWDGVRLVPRDVRAELYGDELAKRAFQRALEIDPSSAAAYAGLVRSWVAQDAKVEELGQLGEDVEDLAAWTNEGQIAVNLAGVEAVDTALLSAVEHEETRTSVALCRTLGRISSVATEGLRAALTSGQSVMRAEAAIALSRIAMGSGHGEVFNGTVEALAEAVGREVQRIAVVIDSNATRAQSMVDGLRAAGYYAYGWGTGAKGLAQIKRVPGVDVIFVGDKLVDLTTFQVIADLQRDRRTASTPIIVLSDDADKAEQLFGDKVAGINAGAAQIGELDELLSGGLNRDREQADSLAKQAASSLSQLARSGLDVSPAIGALTGTLANRPDDLVLPAMEAIAVQGGEAALPALTALIANGDRSDRARWGAARACAGIFRRGGQPSGEEQEVLFGIVNSDAALEVRTAVAYALGNLDLDPARRAQAVIVHEAVASE